MRDLHMVDGRKIYVDGLHSPHPHSLGKFATRFRGCAAAPDRTTLCSGFAFCQELAFCSSIRGFEGGGLRLGACRAAAI